MAAKLNKRIVWIIMLFKLCLGKLPKGNSVIFEIQERYLNSSLSDLGRLDFRFIQQCGNIDQTGYYLFAKGPKSPPIRTFALQAIATEKFDVVYPSRTRPSDSKAVNGIIKECLKNYRLQFTPHPGMESDGCKSRYRMGVDEAWGLGYSGKGIVVAVVDAGVDPSIPDLHNVVNESLSFNFVDNNTDFRPATSAANPYSDHGNNCAGMIAARRNNNICGEGIAYDAKVAALKVFDTDQGYALGHSQIHTFQRIASKALKHRLQDIHVYSNSWGADGVFYDVPMINEAIEIGIKEGRDRAGSIYVFPSTRIGSSLTNTEFTITINGVGGRDNVPSYSTTDASVIASTYGEGPANVTDKRCIASNQDEEMCTSGIGGTSRACAEAAGIFALVLEKRPDLTWRDVQYIAIESSDPIGNYSINGAGKRYHPVFGYGLLNAFKAVTLASQWKPVRQRALYKYVDKLFIPEVNQVKDDCQYSHTIRIRLDDICLDIEKVEHVIAKISYQTVNERNIRLALISPSGTRSVLMDNGQAPRESVARDNVKFLSVHFWGEQRISGSWKLEMSQINSNCNGTESGIEQFALHIYGLSKNNSTPNNQKKANCSEITLFPTIPTPIGVRNNKSAFIITTVTFINVSAVLVIVVGIYVFRKKRNERRQYRQVKDHINESFSI